MAIEQQNGDYNLTTTVTVYNKTAAADGQWLFDIRIGDGTKNLNTAAGTLTLAVTIGGATLNGGTISTAKDSTVLRAAHGPSSTGTTEVRTPAFHGGLSGTR